ncbi:MAG: DUF1353 domain-containing protein [Victivallis sp.]
MKIEVHSEDERGNIVRLLKPVKFRFREKTFIVHAGFECDGVSVPRPAWPLVSPQIDPRSLRAGIAHDYIYRVQPEGWTRAEADLMFLCFLIEDGLAVPRALAAYVAVRVCGRKAWNDNRKLLEGA